VTGGENGGTQETRRSITLLQKHHLAMGKGEFDVKKVKMQGRLAGATLLSSLTASPPFS